MNSTVKIKLVTKTRELKKRNVKRNSFSYLKPIRSQSNPKLISEVDIVKSEFQELKLIGPLLRCIEDMKYEKPTEIQKQMIPIALKGQNCVATAVTGSGKTAGFALPLLHRLNMMKMKEKKDGTLRNGPLAVVLCPTRELAEQVMDMIISYATRLEDFRVIGVSGSLKNRNIQITELKKGIDILVSTPGRLLTLADSDEDEFKLDLSTVKILVLDEVDKMLDMGLMPDLKHIYKLLPKAQVKKSVESMQIMMLSATLVPRVFDLVKRFAPRHIRINLNWKMDTPTGLDQKVYQIDNHRKFPLLLYLLKRKGSLRDKTVIVFCRTKQKVDRIKEKLEKENFKVNAIHRDQSLQSRQKIMADFKQKKIQILVATDVMARGIDVPDLDGVVIYDIPHLPEQYIHQIGRTARVEKKGISIALLGKQPTLLELDNRAVILDESVHFERINMFVSKRLNIQKIPGTWSDPEETYIPTVSESLQKKHDEHLRLLIDRTKKRTKHIESIPHKKRTKEDRMTLHISRKKRPVLRDFAEGRYEDVIFDLEVKNAQRKGVVVPDDFESRVRLLEIAERELRDEKLGNLQN